MRSLFVLFIAASVGLVTEVPRAHATTLTIQAGRSLRLTQIADFPAPVNDGESPADNSGRLFVVQQNGTIDVIQNGVVVPGPAFLTAANIPNFSTSFGGETGLIGLAFHPDFANPGTPGFGKFYTLSSQSKPLDASNNIIPADFFNHTDYGGGVFENLPATGGTYQNVIREWTATDPTANVFSGTSTVVMSIAKQAGNHNGGGLAFGTAAGDRNNLYIALGDGGDSNDHGSSFTDLNDGHTNNTGNAQDKNVVYGKILRIDPLGTTIGGRYSIPAGNAFPGASDGLDEIFAYGFRNPFRIGFDPVTNTLYAGDVGQGAREEVDKVVSGGNYGWVNFEGTLANPNSPSPPSPLVGTKTDPFAEYTHPNGGAVIGGYVNRGPNLPDLLGYYIFGDLTSKLLYVDPNDPAGVIRQFAIDISNGGPSLSPGVNGFGRDQAGHLYVLLADGRVLLIPEPSTGILALFAFGATVAVAVARRGREKTAQAH